MKCCIPEISWHNRDPVLSVDIQPNIKGDKTELTRLASGGTDSHVLIWYMTLNDSGSINLDLAADLTRHQRAVNVVKWSPNGELLASGDDESVIFIWKLKGESEPVNIVDSTNEQDKEIWITLKILRGHMEDVYDLSWCHNSQFLVSGSVDNTAIIWDINKGKSQCILRDHKGFVQGVAWDPQNQYIATLSTDRYMRIFDIQTKKVVSRSCKSTLPVPKSSEFYGKQMRIFHDDTLQTFFRRLCFSPDGKLLITPAGVTDFDGVNKPVHTSYIYSRYSLKQPSIVLPSPDQYTVAAKFCPVLFTLRPHNESNKPVIPLPYRMIFALATKSSVYLYDTQQQMPFGLISNIHYTRLTDLTWSSDGRILIVSSTDGFCSLITFAEGELGEIYEDASSIIKIRQNDKGKSKNGKGGGTDNKKDNSNKIENENLKPSNDNKIALKVKDVNSHKENNEEDVSSDKEKKAEVVKANPIAIRRKPRTEAEIKKSESCIENDKNIENKKRIEDEIMEIDDQSDTNENIEKDKKQNVEKKSELKVNEQETQSNNDKKLGPSETSNKSDSAQKEIGIDLIKDSEAKDFIKTSPQSEKKDNWENDAQTLDNTAKPICSKPEIILDKDIISSDNKFVSPEKKCRPLTHISVRRQPRNSPSSSSEDQKLKSEKNQEKITPSKTPKSVKKATPIAVRKQPRCLIPNPVEKTAIVEEALDAWPIDKLPATVALQPSPAKKVIKVDKQDQSPNISRQDSYMSGDKTEDIRLIYESSQDSQEIEKNLEKIAADQEPSGSKTPRRVELKTISTPKSKKKIFD